jgi:molybdate transport system permease protein
MRSAAQSRRPTALPSIGSVVAAAAVALFLALLVLPIIGLLIRVPPAVLVERLGSPAVTRALWLSLLTSLGASAVVIALGVPVAYLLARRRFRFRRALEALIDLPMVLPPTVAGVGLLLAFGRTGFAGRALAPLGITIPFTTVAVMIAQAFVAGPFFINAARAGFEAVDPQYLRAAATLRASPFYTFARVVLPLSVPALLAGAAMTWARALGEFGATITFAGNLPGVTQTMPIAVYIALQSDLEASVALSVILLVFSFGLLLALRHVPRVVGR